MDSVSNKHNYACELASLGRFQEALETFEWVYTQEQRPGYLMKVGMAKLSLKDHEGAFATLYSCLQSSPYPADANYVLVGVCKWCIDERELAIDLWKQGLKCNYTDAAGGISIPLLLVFAGVRLGDEVLQREGEDLIATKLKGRFAKNWPAPLGRFMVGQVSETDVLAEIAQQPELMQRRTQVRFEFYRAVSQLRDGHREEYERFLQHFVSAIPLHLSPEWHLARHDLESDSSTR